MIAVSILRGQKVVLRPFRWTDVPYQHRWMNDREVSHFLKVGGDVPIEDVEEWYDVPVDPDDPRTFAILAGEGEVIGAIQLRKISWDHSWGELAMLIGEKAYWGKGYGTDAVRTFLRWCFQDIGLNRVELHVLEYNQRATRCYEKAGFSKEGVLRRRFFREGRYWDLHVMGILREEWETSASKDAHPGG